MGKILILTAVRFVSAAASLDLDQQAALTAAVMAFVLLLDTSVIAADMERR